MLVTGLTLDEFRDIVKTVSEDYDSNLTVHQDAHALSANRFRARVDVQSSRENGARRSWSGRRVKAACWHAYRDVLAELFERYPDARVYTQMATYVGRDGFYENYPQTAYTNVGSMMQPAYMPELCDH